MSKKFEKTIFNSIGFLNKNNKINRLKYILKLTVTGFTLNLIKISKTTNRSILLVLSSVYIHISELKYANKHH